MKSSDINLLKAKTILSPQLIAMEGQLRSASLVLLFALFLSGMVSGIGYVIIRRQHNRLVVQQQSLMTAIGTQIRKEGFYVSLKDRLAIIGNILKGQRSWLGVLDLIDRVTEARAKTSFTVNEGDQVSLTITNATLEDTFTMVERILLEVADKTIANPILESIQYQKDGTVRVSLTFTPIF